MKRIMILCLCILMLPTFVCAAEGYEYTKTEQQLKDGVQDEINDLKAEIAKWEDWIAAEIPTDESDALLITDSMYWKIITSFWDVHSSLSMMPFSPPGQLTNDVATTTPPTPTYDGQIEKTTVYGVLSSDDIYSQTTIDGRRVTVLQAAKAITPEEVQYIVENSTGDITIYSAGE